MGTQLSYQAPCIELGSINNLWLQLTERNCNLKCKYCYLNKLSIIRVKDYLPLDKIKSVLESPIISEVKNIYLNGGEPLLHPDINSIIRMSLKYANVTILTNGLLLNEKKARFLRQIEDKYDNEIIFRISLDHYIEEKHDELRGRGSYKKAVSGIENIINYGFNPIISIVNFWNEDVDELKQGFKTFFKKINFDLEDINFKIMPVLKKGEYERNFEGYKEHELVQSLDPKTDLSKFDCSNTRVVTNSGIYACPALIGDPRGKVGDNINDLDKKVFLESGCCYTCKNSNDKLFNNNWI